MLNKFKFNFNNIDNNGFTSIEVIIVFSIVLLCGLLGIKNI